MSIKKGFLSKPLAKAKKAPTKKEFSEQIGIKLDRRRQSASPQLWETSRSKHIKRGKSFFGIR